MARQDTVRRATATTLDRTYRRQIDVGLERSAVRKERLQVWQVMAAVGVGKAMSS